MYTAVVTNNEHNPKRSIYKIVIISPEDCGAENQKCVVSAVSSMQVRAALLRLRTCLHPSRVDF